MSNEIQKARGVLAGWRDEATSAPWKFNEDGWLVVGSAEFGGRFADLGGDIDTARLIAGVAGNPELLDAIDGLLAHVWKYPAWTSGHMGTYAEHIAAAIIAADERMSA